MQVVDFDEFTQDIPKFFKTALYYEVIIENSDGNNYTLLSLEDIPRIKLNITTQEIVEILQESRAGLYKQKNTSTDLAVLSLSQKLCK